MNKLFFRAHYSLDLGIRNLIWKKNLMSSKELKSCFWILRSKTGQI